MGCGEGSFETGSGWGASGGDGTTSGVMANEGERCDPPTRPLRGRESESYGFDLLLCSEALPLEMLDRASSSSLSA